MCVLHMLNIGQSIDLRVESTFALVLARNYAVGHKSRRRALTAFSRDPKKSEAGMELRMDWLLVAGLLCAVLGTAPVAGELQCMENERREGLS